MDNLKVLPDAPIRAVGPASTAVLQRGWSSFHQLAQGLLDLPYGYNGEPLAWDSVLREGFGTCTTKHALAAACAAELGLPVWKALGVWVMDAKAVPGLGPVLADLEMDCCPALHCFLQYGHYRVDLTEGNCNGKNGPIDSYLHIEACEVLPNAEKTEAILLRGVERFMEIYQPGSTVSQIQRAVEVCKKHLRSLVACAPRN